MAQGDGGDDPFLTSDDPLAETNMVSAEIMEVPIDGEGEDVDAERARIDSLPPERMMGVVFLSMFQAYAVLQNMQFTLKKTMGVSQEGQLAIEYTNAVVMVHVGKLLSRLGHEIVFARFPLTARVYIAMGLAFVATLIPPIFIFGYGSKSLAWIFISYGLTGVGIGVFEVTFLAVITPLGKQTKLWAIMGIPLGFFTVGVPGMALLGAGMHPVFLYGYVACCIAGSMMIVYRRAPHSPQQLSGHSRISISRSSIQAWRLWLPMLLPHLLGKCFVNFGMENLIPVIGFTFNAKTVSILGPINTGWIMNKDNFQAIENVVIFFGDTASRRVPYYLHLRSHGSTLAVVLAAMACPVVGLMLMKTATAWVAWISGFLAFWGNGLVYAVGSRHIDKHVPKEHHIMAYSIWCFAGDIASVVGAKSQDVVRDWICGGQEYQYQCRPS